MRRLGVRPAKCGEARILERVERHVAHTPVMAHRLDRIGGRRVRPIKVEHPTRRNEGESARGAREQGAGPVKEEKAADE